MSLTEGSLNLVECFNPESNTCPLISICLLSLALKRATRAIMVVLDELTLADIATNKGQLLARIARLATELGTAREVISRVLQDFQKRALVSQSRRRITLTDVPALSDLASSK